MDWYGFTRKYVWDESKTPYFTSVAQLNRVQAHKELFFYAFMLALLFGMVFMGALKALIGTAHTGALVWAVYALLIICSAVWLSWRKSSSAAWMCATAPLSVLAHFAVSGFQPGQGVFDKVLLLGFVLLWLRYAWRTLRIARAYPDLPAAVAE